MNRDYLDDAVAVMLRTELGLEVGESDVPRQDPDVPYLIMSQSPSPAPEGDWEEPESMPYFDYAIKSVGTNHKETTRTSSRVRQVMVKKSNGQWESNLSASGFEIVDRKTVSLGAVIKSAGPDLFEVNDIYRICVTGDWSS